jgi:glutamate 5-kinase
MPLLKRLVVKVGSSLLTEGKTRGVQQAFLSSLAGQIQRLQAGGVDSIVVTSGAIAVGMHELNLNKRPREIPRLQALAAVGQCNLMHAYKTTFKKNKLKVAQILLTQDDLSDRDRYTNAHNTFSELLRNRIIPVVNENDTVAVEEVRFGDNDTLAMLVTHWTEADLLILLTDTDGFYEEDPRRNPKARLISEVKVWDPRYEAAAAGTRSRVGTGGMDTKIRAARNMMLSGIPMVIANGRELKVLEKICAGKEVGTFFHPSPVKMTSRKRWLAWSVKAKGQICVDEGARKALVDKQKSLLPSGIQSLKGDWKKGDVVQILSPQGREIAKGLSSFDSAVLEKIKGLRTDEIRERLGPATPEEAVHRDNMVHLHLEETIYP